MRADYELGDILRGIGLPFLSRKVYMELLKHGEATPRLLSERLSITRPSTYDHLAILMKKGLVVERQIGNKAYFAADDVRHISTMLTDSIDTLTEQRNVFETLLPELIKNTHTESPKIRFFEGTEGLTHLLNDALHNHTGHIYTMWPYDEMVEVLGKEPLIRFNERRLQEKITLHTLWPHHKKMGDEYIWNGKDTLTERRRAQKGVTWSMGYSIYGDRVSFIASRREVFGFIVSSEEFSALMRIQFDALWRESLTYETATRSQKSSPSRQTKKK